MIYTLHIVCVCLPPTREYHKNKIGLHRGWYLLIANISVIFTFQICQTFWCFVGPGDLRAPPVVAVASIAGHCLSSRFLSSFGSMLFNHFGDTQEDFYMGTHILTKLEGICVKSNARRKKLH